jgi:hypothetical protein
MSSPNAHSVTILAFGRRGYGLSAHNAVLSLRHHGYNGPIDLFITEQLQKVVPPMDGVELHTIESADPGYLKLELPDLIKRPTLYMDADSIAIADVTPLIEALNADGREFITSVQGTGNALSPAIAYFAWAKPAKVAAKEGFANDATLYGIQSSWMWMRPSAKLSAIGDRARQSYLRWNAGDFTTWGGSKPDELFWGIACTDLGVNPWWYNEPMWYGSGTMDHARIKSNHVMITIPGQRQTMAVRALQIYDLEVRKFAGHKSAYIFGDKHTNFKTQHHGLRIMQRQ